jgi:hypothetical protein
MEEVREEQGWKRIDGSRKGRQEECQEGIEEGREGRT